MRWWRRVLIGFWSLFASAVSHAHLLNMTKVVASVDASGALAVDVQVDLTRAAGGPLEYYQLSRIGEPKADAQIAGLMDRLAAAIDLRLDGAAIPLRWEGVELPKVSQEEFVNPLNWPMTHVTLSGSLPPAPPVTARLQGTFRPSFPFEEPISLTFSADAENTAANGAGPHGADAHDTAASGTEASGAATNEPTAEPRTMTRWLVASQASPTFPLHEGAGSSATADARGDASDDTGSLLQYVGFGFTHILPRGLDHVLFVLGLYLGARSFRSLLVLVTCFTVAHSITLALASVGAVRLPASIVEPLIAASIVWVAVENLFIQRTGRWRPLLVFCFGLLHGLGFASALSELRLPAESFLLSLLCFNMGIELGQLAVIALSFVVTAAFVRRPWYRSRMAVPASIAIAILAAFWTVERAAAQSPVHPPAGQSAQVVVKLIALNDFHGQLSPPGSGTRITDVATLPTGGVAYLATLVAQLKAQNPLNAVVAAGDLIGASPIESSLFHDEPSIEALSGLGLEFSAIGNHEFDEGVPELRRIQNGGCHKGKGESESTCRRGRFAGASFRYLAANVFDTRTGKHVFPATAIKTLDIGSGRKKGRALKIGFVGAVVKGVPDLVISTFVRKLRFTDEAEAVNAEVPSLRAQGADIIVLLIHEGGRADGANFDDASCPDLSGAIVPILDRLDPAISVVISGHTHKTYICQRNGRLLTSAGSQGRYITDVDLTIDRKTQLLVSASARQLAVVNDLAPNPLPERYPTLAKDEKIGELVRFYSAAAEPLSGRVIAQITSDITRETSPAGESAMGDLIADAQLAATSALSAGGAQIALMNAAGMRSDFLARSGHVTYGSVKDVHPFANSLITVTLTGEQIDRLLEQQWQGGLGVLQPSTGFTYEWSASAPPGSRVDIRNIRLNGVPIEPTARYRVTACEFLTAGGDGFKVFAEGTDPTRGVLDAEAMEQYLATHSPIAAPAGGRIQRN